MSDRSYRWAWVGLAVLASISAGVLTGEQASADMAPFYANLATTMPDEPKSHAVEVVSADDTQAWVGTADLASDGNTAQATQDESY